MSVLSGSLQPLNAAQELAVLRRAPALIPSLMGSGLSLEDAAALAHNATLLSYALGGGLGSPKAVLNQLSLGEIAALCQELAALQIERKEESQV